MATRLTRKGAATRSRIVEAATDLVLERGAVGTSLDDIRERTATSKSQLFHYFPDGKGELVGAIAGFQMERVLDAQRPYLDRLDSWEDWQGWREAVVAHYSEQGRKCCAVSKLASELSGTDPERAAEVAAHMDRWRGYLESGLRRMHDGRLLRADVDPATLALTIFAALQGGLLLMQTMDSVAPLAAALDGALAALRDAAPR